MKVKEESDKVALKLNIQKTNIMAFVPSAAKSLKSCPTPYDPMTCSTPGFPVLHQFLELAQTHVHRVSDAIQPSHPLSPPSPPAFHLSQHQGLLQ